MECGVWLTWETQRRNRSLSAELGAELFEFDHPRTGITRYVVSTIRTLTFLRKRRPTLIFAQNPSIVLACVAVLYGMVTRTPVIIDAHNAGVFPSADGRKSILTRFNSWILRSASLVLVSNEGLKYEIARCGGRSFALPDPLPLLPPPTTPAALKGKHKVLFVCTWAEDEPYLEVLRAAEHLKPDTHLYITGNSKGRETAAGEIAPNVTLTGFVSESEFVALLHAVDIIVDLTTRADCLVCGAYEAVSIGKPMVLSDADALKRYFNKGALYTNNTAEDIASKIEQAISRRQMLANDVQDLKLELEHDWLRKKTSLVTFLAEVIQGRSDRKQESLENPHVPYVD